MLSMVAAAVLLYIVFSSGREGLDGEVPKPPSSGITAASPLNPSVQTPSSGITVSPPKVNVTSTPLGLLPNQTYTPVAPSETLATVCKRIMTPTQPQDTTRILPSWLFTDKSNPPPPPVVRDPRVPTPPTPPAKPVAPGATPLPKEKYENYPFHTSSYDQVNSARFAPF